MGKRNLGIGLFVVVLTSLGLWLGALRTPQVQPDLITLKSGTMIKAEIVQQEFGKYIVVRTDAGVRQVIIWDQIESIELSFPPWYLRLNDALDWIVRLGVLSGFIIFGVGIWQYGQSQKWKRAEFLLSEIRLFEPKQNIVNVRRILDNENAEVYLYGKNEPLVHVDRNMLAKAFTDSPAQGGQESGDIEAIRIVFNSYLSHLDHFNNLIDSGLIRKQEIKLYIEHYLDIIGNSNNPKLSPDVRYKLWKYMESEGYQSSIRLLQKFKYRFPQIKEKSTSDGEEHEIHGAG
jgi:hypothetical protein